MINRLVHPMFLTSLKLGESHESSTEVALDVVLKMLVTTWAKLVCSSSHVGMFWTEKVALVWSSQRRFSNTPKSIQQSVAARQLSSLCTAYTQYSTQLLVTTERLTEARLAWRSSTTECLLRGASLSATPCTPFSGVETAILRESSEAVS